MILLSMDAFSGFSNCSTIPGGNLENAMLLGAKMVIADLLRKPGSSPHARMAVIKVAFSYMPAAIVSTSRGPELAFALAALTSPGELSGTVTGPVSWADAKVPDASIVAKVTNTGSALLNITLGFERIVHNSARFVSGCSLEDPCYNISDI